MQLTHRPYQASDREACIALFLANVPRSFHADELPDFIVHLNSLEGMKLVVLAGGALVGCGGFSPGDDGLTASLCWGMVHPAHHKKRVGEYLLRARLHAIAATTRATHIRLATSQHSQGFFVRYGFEVQSIQPDGFAPGLDAVEMRLETRGISQQD